MSEDQKSNPENELNLEGTESMEELSKKLKAEPDSETDPNSTLLAENEKLKSDLLYLKAEFDNYKRNAIKERSNLVKFGNERLIVELVDVLDIFDTALNTEVNPENIDSFVEGMKMTSSQLKSKLENFGVTSDSPMGKNFDPAMHEALSSEPTDQYEPGQISQVFKKLYQLHSKVIRPAQVVVAKEK